jgi:hypothetical protein
VTDDLQHRRNLGIIGADVAFDEGIVVFKVAQRSIGHDRAPEVGVSSFRRKPESSFDDRSKATIGSRLAPG